NLNTSENRERIIGYDDTTTTTTTTNSEYSGSCGENATWSFDETTGTLTISGTGDMYNYDSFTDTPYNQFSFGKIKIAVIEDGITSIGSNAFDGCTCLEKVTIPDSVTYIGEYAFYDCVPLTEVTIPNGVTYIGKSAFAECKNLSKVTIPNSVTTIYDSTFSGCIVLREVTISDSVTSIGKYAFGDCSLSEVTIPDSVTSIGDMAFGYIYDREIGSYVKGENFIIRGYTGSAAETYATENGFTFVILGDTTTTTNSEYSGSCGDNATWSLDTTTGTLTISGTGDMYDYDNIHFSTDELSSPWHKVIHDISDIKSIVVEEGITSIGKTAFLDLDLVESVQLPSTLKSIGEDAFRCWGSCENIFKTITIPESVTYIGDCALGYYDFSYSDENGDLQYGTDMYELTIKGYAGSAAETYATENGFTFVTLDNTDTTTSTSADTTTTNDDTTTTTTSNGDTDTTTTTASDGSAGTGDKGIIPILLIASLTGAVVITINKKNK
ncbi:MAG: leucine-rich repeat domain-containing protein, partial [Ruminococcus sp.]|nr:leucine-rich repeat domain-containing protein [Ruminococcus sp.]